jgi:hypothetical protein
VGRTVDPMEGHLEDRKVGPLVGRLGVLMVDLMGGRSGVRRVGPMEGRLEDRMVGRSGARKEGPMEDRLVGRSGVRKVGPMEGRLEVRSAAQREAHLGVRLVAMQAQQVEEGAVLQPWSVGLGATKAVLQPIRVEEIL